MAMSLALGGRRLRTSNLHRFSSLPKNAIRSYRTYKEEFEIDSCYFSFETPIPNQFDADAADADAIAARGVVMTMRDMRQSMLRTTIDEETSKVMSTTSRLNPWRKGPWGNISNSFPRIIVNYQKEQHTCQDSFGALKDCGSRIIRTPIRPLFPSGFTHDVQVNAKVLCCSKQLDADIIAANATSAALMLSDIPWDGPIGVVRVGRIQGQFVVNPVKSELHCCDIDLIYACTRDKTLMVDVQAHEVAEEDLEAALELAHQEAVKFIDPQIKLAKKVGDFTKEYNLSMFIKENTFRKLESLADAPFEVSDSATCEKSKGEEYLAKITEDVKRILEVEECADEQIIKLQHPHIVDKLQKNIFRRWNVEKGIRLDGRCFEEVRPVDCKSSRSAGLQGSAFFACGAAQVSCTVTQMKPGRDEADPQAEFEDAKDLRLANKPISYPRYMYKTRPFKIDVQNCGHDSCEAEDGTFIENALVAVLPREDIFPYVVCVSPQVVLHNGSASTATVCGGSIALMDAGVPLRKHVAGVSMGLVREVPSGGTKPEVQNCSRNRYQILTDLSSFEEKLGDMNFKIAGSWKGITAVQLDLNVAGVPLDILCACFRPALDARLQILDRMEQEISVPRYCVSNDWLWPYPIIAKYFLPAKAFERMRDADASWYDRDLGKQITCPLWRLLDPDVELYDYDTDDDTGERISTHGVKYYDDDTGALVTGFEDGGIITVVAKSKTNHMQVHRKFTNMDGIEVEIDYSEYYDDSKAARDLFIEPDYARDDCNGGYADDLFEEEYDDRDDYDHEYEQFNEGSESDDDSEYNYSE